MKTCKTCKYWIESLDFRAGDRECNSKKIHEEAPKNGETDHLSYSFYEGGGFFPGPDFGCVHHEEREKSEDPWTLGCEAGAKYFNDGVQRGRWEYPESGPYPQRDPRNEDWWNGFSSGEDAAESSWECG